MKAHWLIVPICCLVAIGACSAPTPAQETVAVVNGTPILLSDYQKGYRDYLFSGGLPDESTRRSAYLNRMIAIQLIVAEAREGGIETTPEYQEARARARQKLLIEAYLSEEVYPAVQVTENDLVDMFVRVNTQMTARHLFSTSKSGADRLYARLQAGEDWDELAREVFADPVLSQNGGLVGSFGFDEMDPAFEETAYRIRVGEISEPVRTAQGYSIIRVDDRSTKEILTETEFAERRDKLGAYVLSRKQGEARREFLEDVVARAAVQIDPTVASGLLGQISTPDTEQLQGTFIQFLADGESVSWTLAQFREAADQTSDRQRMAVDNETDLRAFAEGLVARYIILTRAESAGLARDARVRRGLDGAMSEWIYEQAFDQLVRNMEFSEEDLRAYFDTYSGEFTIPSRVRVSEIVVATKAQGDSLRAAAQNTPFADLARRHSLRPASAASGGDLGFYTREQLGPWADNVFDAAAGQIVGPMASAGKYILIRVGAREDTRQANFDEVREQVEAMLRRERQQDYLREHVQMLRRRYPVQIVIDSLDEIPLSETAHV